ncbi:MAG: hypothetical protein ACOYOA_13445 [Saprospiraceae bacterium]
MFTSLLYGFRRYALYPSCFGLLLLFNQSSSVLPIEFPVSTKAVIDNAAFECFPNLSTNELVVKCKWNGSARIISFLVENTANQGLMRVEKSVSKGIQIFRIDISELDKGKYEVYVDVEGEKENLRSAFEKK